METTSAEFLLVVNSFFYNYHIEISPDTPHKVTAFKLHIKKDYLNLCRDKSFIRGSHKLSKLVGGWYTNKHQDPMYKALN